jgi:hypothetical protein
VLVATPAARASDAQLGVTICEAASGERATVFVRPEASVDELHAEVQQALGVPTDVQQLVFASAVLQRSSSVGAAGIKQDSTVQLVVGRRRSQEAAALSPDGSWR